INNGGYLQFLVNYGQAGYEYASRALKAIGARRTAEMIDHGQALIDEHFDSEGRTHDERVQMFPNQCIGRDGRIIKEAGSILPDSVLARLSELSYEYMGYPEELWELAQSHYGPLIESDKPA